MGYPLVPGYEAAGEVVEAGPGTSFRPGDMVFVPGANCYGEIRGLFGGATNRLVTPAERVVKIDRAMGAEGALLALAATGRHAIAGLNTTLPDLIVGHGVFGRLLARLTLAAGGAAPSVWEINPDRMHGRARLRCRASGRRSAPRLPLDLRRFWTVRPSGHLDRPARQGRRGRARGLLPRAAVLRLPARLHEGGALPHRGRMDPRRPGGHRDLIEDGAPRPRRPDLAPGRRPTPRTPTRRPSRIPPA
jgi:hypothetical protein